MSDEKLDRLLKRLDATPVDLDAAEFQTKVWTQLDSGSLSDRAFAGLGKVLALRAAPAVIALVVGGFVGASMIPSASQQDMLAVFEADSEWSITTLVSSGGPS